MNKHCDTCICDRQPVQVEGAEARLFGVPVYTNPIVPPGQVWIGPSVDDFERLVQVVSNLVSPKRKGAG